LHGIREGEGGTEMIPENRIPTHPGIVLEEEFLLPLGLTQVALAKHLGVSTQRVNELIRGKRGVTPQTAWLLAGAFGTTPQFWLNLQANYDLAVSRPRQTVQPLVLAI
jgi:addiction module HigA family antidote